MAALGAVIADGDDIATSSRWSAGRTGRRSTRLFNAAYGGFRRRDLYPDAVPALDALRERGLSHSRSSPTSRPSAPRSCASSGIRPRPHGHERGVGRPQAAARVLHAGPRRDGRSGRDVAYVGDRLDNDVRPSAAAGIRPVWIRRGPWGVIAREARFPTGTLVVDSLAELVERIGEWWP